MTEFTPIETNDIVPNDSPSIDADDDVYIIDWLGRKRTIDDIKQRDEVRCCYFLVSMFALYLVSLLISGIFTLVFIIKVSSVHDTRNIVGVTLSGVIFILLASPWIIGFIAFVLTSCIDLIKPVL